MVCNFLWDKICIWSLHILKLSIQGRFTFHMWTLSPALLCIIPLRNLYTIRFKLSTFLHTLLDMTSMSLKLAITYSGTSTQSHHNNSLEPSSLWVDNGIRCKQMTCIYFSASYQPWIYVQFLFDWIPSSVIFAQFVIDARFPGQFIHTDYNLHMNSNHKFLLPLRPWLSFFVIWCWALHLYLLQPGIMPIINVLSSNLAFLKLNWFEVIKTACHCNFLPTMTCVCYWCVACMLFMLCCMINVCLHTSTIGSNLKCKYAYM